MEQACWTFPILPGRGDRARDFLVGLTAAHNQDYIQSARRLGVQRSHWFLTDGPGGEQLVFYLESTDVHLSYDRLIRSREPFDLWFKGQLAGVTGLDLNDPLEGTRPPELLASLQIESL